MTEKPKNKAPETVRPAQEDKKKKPAQVVKYIGKKRIVVQEGDK